MCPPNSGHHGESTQYRTIQTKYVFKTSFDGHSGLFQTTLISHCLTSRLPKPTLILAKSLTSESCNRGFLFRRKSVCHDSSLSSSSSGNEERRGYQPRRNFANESQEPSDIEAPLYEERSFSERVLNLDDELAIKTDTVKYGAGMPWFTCQNLFSAYIRGGTQNHTYYSRG